MSARSRTLRPANTACRRQRPAERQRDVRIRRRGQAMVHDLRDEARHAEELRRQGARIGMFRRRWRGVRCAVADDARQVHVVVVRIAAEAFGPQRRGRGGEIPAMLQQGENGERRVGPVRLEGRSVGREDVQHAVPERRAPTLLLAGPAPVFVVAARTRAPSRAARVSSRTSPRSLKSSPGRPPPMEAEGLASARGTASFSAQAASIRMARSASASTVTFSNTPCSTE